MSRPSIIVSCLVVLLIATVLGRTTTTTKNSPLSVADRLSLLDPEDKEIFIKVHLAQGLNIRVWDIPYAENDTVVELPKDLNISENKYEEIQEMDVPNDFSENLLDYTREKFQLDYDDVHTLVKNSQVCFPNGHCTDVDDIGSICCPF